MKVSPLIIVERELCCKEEEQAFIDREHQLLARFLSVNQKGL
jgi:hypothetical protein